MSPGTKVKIQISRGGKERTVEATLGKFDENPNSVLTGVDVAPLTVDLRRRLGIPARISGGLVITSIEEDSPYADRLAVGVVILQIDREDVADLDAARELLTPGRHMLFVYYRGAVRYVGLEVK
jgi:serine protease Do/serine protease DegQ